MAPKKKEVVEEKPLLGRFKSHLKMGIVGLPNVGKSSLFNLLTALSIPAENFPFCTIDPNSARVTVPDDRFKWLVQTYQPKSQVPAYLDVVDIAGLVRGAAEGEGLGNAFLSHIQAVDGIFHVCRVFEDVDITHVEDRIDPVADLDIITQELRVKDLERLNTRLEDVAKPKRGAAATKEQEEEKAMCEKVIKVLESGTDVRHADWSAKEIEWLNSVMLLTAKPVVYLVNLSEKDYLRKKNKWLPKVAEWVKAHGGEPLIPISVAFEQKLADMPPDDAAAYCKEHAINSQVPRIITTGFKAIQLIYFFTAGADEVKCWQIRKATKAPQAAGAIHTDFERGFICAEVMSYDVLHQLGSESAVKAEGKYRQEGKNYVVQDGDVIHFRFNVTAKGK